jgi:hypothetical protein
VVVSDSFFSIITAQIISHGKKGCQSVEQYQTMSADMFGGTGIFLQGIKISCVKSNQEDTIWIAFSLGMLSMAK